MITKTMLQNGIEDAKKAIRQNLESNQFSEVLLTINAWSVLKELESGSFEEEEVERNFDFFYPLCQPIHNPEKCLEDMDVTITDNSDEFDKVRALIKKYVLEDNRKKAFTVAFLAGHIDRAFLACHIDRKDNEINSLYHKEINSLYHKEFNENE